VNVLFIALGVYDIEGGVERFNRRLIRALAELTQDSVVNHVSIVSLWDTSAAHRDDARISYWGGRRSKVGTLIKFLIEVRKRPSVIIIGHFLLLPLAVVARMLAPRTKISLILHGVEVWGYQSRTRRWMARRFIDRFLAVSAYTANRAGRRLRLPSAYFDYLPNAVDVLPTQSKATRSEDNPALLSVSRLGLADTYKNIGLVIEALPEVKNELGRVTYNIVGDGALLATLRNRVGALGLADSVRFHGQVSESTKASLYRDADLFILPSMREGFGIVFLEAWNHGVPLIASSFGGVTELINHGDDGFLVDPDPPAIAGAICRLIVDPQLRGSLARRGRQRVIDEFSHDAFTRRVSSILGSL